MKHILIILLALPPFICGGQSSHRVEFPDMVVNGVIN